METLGFNLQNKAAPHLLQAFKYKVHSMVIQKNHSETKQTIYSMQNKSITNITLPTKKQNGVGPVENKPYTN